MTNISYKKTERPERGAVVHKEVSNDGNDHTVQKEEGKPGMMGSKRILNKMTLSNSITPYTFFLRTTFLRT